MNCFRSCAGSAGFTTSTPGGPPKSAMWVKSRSGSNGKLFESTGAMQCVATPETTRVYPSGAAMEMTGEQLIPVSQAEVWRGLNDPEVLMACIAGCESIDKVSDNEYRVVIVAAVGPVKAKFSGKLLLSDLNPPNSYSLSFEG